MKYLAVLLGMFVFVSSVQAEVIEMLYRERTWNNTVYTHEVKDYSPFTVNLSGMLTYDNWKTNDPDLNVPKIHAFAADLDHIQFYGKTEYAIYDVVDEPRKNLLEELWGRHYDDLWTGNITDHENKVSAFSLAVWEITHEQTDTLDVLTNSTLLTPFSPKDDTGLANLWLSELDGTGPRQEVKRLVPLLPGGNWKSMYVGTGQTVPEPSSLVLLIGLAACGLFIYRKHR